MTSQSASSGPGHTHRSLRSQAELELAWKQVLESQGDGSAGEHSLWLMMIEDQGPLPQVIEITEAVTPPDDRMVASLATFLDGLADRGRSFAFLRARPGHAGLTTEDRAWARSLYDAGRMAGVPLEVVHRVCDHDLVPVPMDEVA